MIIPRLNYLMMKRAVKLLSGIMFFVVVPMVLNAQAITATLVSRSACPGEIIVPVRVTNFNNVSAFSLAFSFNPSILTYTGYQNFHPALPSEYMSVNANNGKVYVTWASSSPGTIGADTLIKIKFSGITGSSALTWDTQTPGNCEFTDEYGNIIPSTYTHGTATIFQPPAISSHPSNVSVMAGQNTSFSVGASGYGVIYQWQISTNGGGSWANLSNGGNYSNVTGATLSVISAQLSMSGYQYRCSVSGNCPSTLFTNTATLTVTPVIVPVTPISTVAGSANVCPGIVTIPVTVANFANVGSFSLVLNFNAGTLTFQNLQNVNNVLSASGVVANAVNGKLYMIWASENGAAIPNNEILFNIVFNGNTGSSSLTWDTQTAGNCQYSDLTGVTIPSNYTNGNSTIYQIPAITSHPVNSTIVAGQNTSFSTGASGQGISYQWQASTNSGGSWLNLTNGGNYSNVTGATLNVINAQLGMSGNLYRCNVSGTCPSSLISNTATLTVTPVIVPVNPVSTTAGISNVCPGNGTIPITVANFVNVGSFSLVLSYNASILAFSELQDINTALSQSEVIVNTVNGKLYLVWASTNGATIANNATLFNIIFSGSSGTSSLSWDTQTTGNCQYSDVSGNIIPSNYTNGSMGFYSPPVITSHPENKSVVAGQSASFSVGASATGINYQWKISTDGGSAWSNLTNNSNYSGVTSATLNVAGTTLSMNGHRFKCTVGGTCIPSITSNSALLGVTAAPQVITIKAGNASAVCAGEIVQPVIATNFNGVASFSLVINYDSIKLRFLRYEGLHQLLNSGTFVSNNYRGKIYFVWAKSTQVDIGNDTLFRIRFSCDGANVTNTWDTQTPGNCEFSDINGNAITTTYTNGNINVNPSCNYSDLQTNYWAYNEIQYLCGRAIISGFNCKISADSLLKRHQLAKIAFLGLFGSNVSVVSDAFPSPFNDLQNTGTYYYRFAKALSYLEYTDGISPFDRDRFNFNPEKNIERILVLKVLLETFNIQPDESGPSPFMDVDVGSPFYGYVKAAADKGIVNTQNTHFRPQEYATRAEAFAMLERIIHNNPLITLPTVANNLNPLTSSFFIPGNYTPYNFSAITGMEQGNFNHYTKTSFSIPGKGIPLNFDHSYNSFLTELPKEFLPLQPLGSGWSHTYNAYLINTDEIRDMYNSVIGKPCMIVFWPDGSMNVYDNAGNPDQPAPITFGVYDELSRITATEYEITTKDQITFSFSKISGAAPDMPYLLTSVSDRNGNTTQINYEIGLDQVPRIQTVNDTLNRQLSFDYQDNTNYISSVADPLSRSVHFIVSNGQLESFTDAKDQITSYYYDNSTSGKDLLTLIEMPKRNIIFNQYQQRKLISTKTNNFDPVTIAHNPNYVSGNSDFSKTVITEPIMTGQAITTNFEFGKIGAATRIYGNPATNYTNQFADSRNPLLPTTITNNNNGVSIAQIYDNKGNITQIKTMGSNVSPVIELFEYNSKNDLVKHTDARGYITVFDYDSHGNLEKVTDALDNETLMEYNASGQIERITNPENLITEFGYSPATGMQNLVKFPVLNLSSTKTFDLASRLKSVTNFNGQTATYDYDNNDNPVNETNAMSYTTGYDYDLNDNLTIITNAKGGETILTYDSITDWLLSTSFQGNARNYSYNFDGSVKTVTDPNGNIFNYTYDNAGRLLNDGISGYSYSSNGNIQSITKSGKSLQFGYDGLNRLSSTTYDGFVVGYDYDPSGNVIKIIYPGNKAVSYTYDALNRMKTVTDWNGKTTTYNYRADGLLLGTIYPNGVTTSYEYDEIGRQTGQVTKKTDGSVVAEYSFLLDPVGNHLREYIDQPLNPVPSIPDSITDYTYNDANRILTADSISFSFDYNGNTTAKTGYYYSYDFKNNLTTLVGNHGANYTYDGTGIRREANYNGQLKKFVIDILGMANVLMETSSNGSPLNYYVYGLGLISRIKPDNTTGYYIYDFRGSTTALVDGSSNANITHKYAYDEFGKVLESEETDFNPFRYVGKYGVMYEDPDHYFMRARYYDCSIGRFLNEDPVWSTNLYEYSSSNFINLIDPLGKNSVEPQPCSQFKNAPIYAGICLDKMEGLRDTGLEIDLAILSFGLSAKLSALKIGGHSLLYYYQKGDKVISFAQFFYKVASNPDKFQAALAELIIDVAIPDVSKVNWNQKGYKALLKTLSNFGYKNTIKFLYSKTGGTQNK